ncbi:serine/threonine protein phosphatase [Phyllobacterium sp. SB3]|uniref:serine/threonine protein phosphatase n=1 Tax=Phyllobacterium sp. SB3 TaxID=3156073 RepID=UPI0032AE8286
MQNTADIIGNAPLPGDRSRVQRVILRDGVVWIKRYGTERTRLGQYLHLALSKVLPLPFLRPSPQLSPPEMVLREINLIEKFRVRGFLAPNIVAAFDNVLVLGDAGETVANRLKAIGKDAGARNALLSQCAGELGQVHAKGLCHGRPHPRDMFIAGERIGFLDFEEDPVSVMPLAVAQARDMWLLSMQIATVDGTDAVKAAYVAWKAMAPSAAVEELGKIVRILQPFLPIARTIRRFMTAKDIYRFALATGYLAMLITADIDPNLGP